jgi:hypothetical protein
MRSIILGVAFAAIAAAPAAAVSVGGAHDPYDAVASHFGDDILGMWVLHPDHIYQDVAGTTLAAPGTRVGRVTSYLPGRPDMVAGARRPTARAVNGPDPTQDYVAWEGATGSTAGGRWMQTESDIGLSGTEFTIALNGFIPFFDTSTPQEVLWYVMQEGDGLIGASSFGVVRPRNAENDLVSRIRLDDGTNGSRKGFHTGEVDDFEPTVWDARAGGAPGAPSTDREMRAWQDDGSGSLAELPFTEQETNFGDASLTDGRLVLSSTSSGHNAADAIFTGAIIALNRLTASDFERQLLADATAPISWTPAVEAPAVPLPAPLALLLTGVAALAAAGRRRAAG